MRKRPILILQILLASLLLASAALASFWGSSAGSFFGAGGDSHRSPYPMSLFAGSPTNEKPFSGVIQVAVQQGYATQAIATPATGFAPYDCGEKGQLCPDAKALLESLGATAFVVQKGDEGNVLATVLPPSH